MSNPTVNQSANPGQVKPPTTYTAENRPHMPGRAPNQTPAMLEAMKKIAQAVEEREVANV